MTPEQKTREISDRMWNMNGKHTHNDLDTILKEYGDYVRRETLEEAMKCVPEEQKKPKAECINAENHLFGSCFDCKKIDGFNDCREQTLTALQALKDK